MLRLTAADTWSAPEMFHFNDALEPIDVAGMSAGWIFADRTVVGESALRLGIS